MLQGQQNSKNTHLEDLEDLAGYARAHPYLGGALLVLMFSLAGLPPFAGFFAKFYVFAAVVQAGFVWLAVLGVLFAVIGAAYCLKILKTFFLDDAIQHYATTTPWTGAKVIAFVVAVLILVMGIFPQGLASLAITAAEGLF